MLTAPTLEALRQNATIGSPRRGELAVALQEAFTAAARLRANRQVAQSAEAFRVQIKQLLATADQEARQAGYEGGAVKLAIFAYIAFLDESVLNSNQSMFSAWPRQPLQEEIFGEHMAGETFFARLDELLGAPDSEDLADLLEIFLLCMLMGFRGRYALGDDGGLRDRIATTSGRIRRIRGPEAEIAPAAALPGDETVPAARDPWLPRLGIMATLCLVLAVVLFIGFTVSLGGMVREIEAVSAQILRP